MNQCGGLLCWCGAQLDVSELTDPEKGIWPAADLPTWAQGALEGMVILKMRQRAHSGPSRPQNNDSQQRRSPVVRSFSFLVSNIAFKSRSRGRRRERNKDASEMDALLGAGKSALSSLQQACNHHKTKFHTPRLMWPFVFGFALGVAFRPLHSRSLSLQLGAVIHRMP